MVGIQLASSKPKARLPPRESMVADQQDMELQTAISLMDTTPVTKIWVPHTDPKVLAPYKHSPGDVPRDVLVQRTRKEYKQCDLDRTLRSLGINYAAKAAETTLAGTIPLHFFDDESFESRTPSQWAPKDGSAPASCRVLRLLAPQAVKTFQKALVHDVDPAANTYLITLVDRPEAEPEWLHRLFICFDAEDPRMYAQRLTAAYRGRCDAEQTLQLSLLVDCMPYGDMPQLSVEQINRMLNSALNNKSLKTQMKLIDTSMLISEINIEYARTLNRIVFDALLAKASAPEPGVAAAAAASAGKPQFEALQPVEHAAELRKLTTKSQKTPPKCRERSRSNIAPNGADADQIPASPLPDGTMGWGVATSSSMRGVSGTVLIVQYDFPECFSKFVFSSLLTKIEAISVLVRTRQECVRLIEKSLFHLQHTKTLSVIDFLQVTMNEATQNYLRDTFVPQLQRSVTSSLERAGKGWFNVHESNHATYEHSKLRKLLTAVRFMMEDTLRTLVINSVNAFERFMLHVCDVNIQINATDDVKLTSRASARPNTLIALDLQLEGEPKKVDFSNDIDMLPDQMVSVMTRSVSGTEGLAQLEPLVMTKLYWAYKPKLATVGQGEELIQRAKGTVHTAWSKIVTALRKYRDLIAEYQPILERNNEAYVKELSAMGSELTLEDVSGQLAEAEKTLETIKKRIPATVEFGPVIVSNTSIKDKLLVTQRDLVTRLLKLLQTAPKDAMAAIGKRYKELQAQLVQKPGCIEDVDTQRRLIEELPSKLSEILEDVKLIHPWYDFLHKKGILLPDDAFRERSNGEGGHMKLWDVVEKVEADLHTSEEQYKDEMSEEQGQFAENINFISNHVNRLSGYTDMAKMEQYSDELEELQQKIKGAQQSATQFNMRETILGTPTSDYSMLKSVNDTFGPFFQFWTSADRWRKLHASWMGDSWTKLDGDCVEKEVLTVFKVMTKTSKVLANRELPACSENCLSIKEEVAAFKAFVPLVRALRNPGMCDRHWDRISEELGVDLHPDDSFTLAKAEDLDLLHEEKLKTVMKISDIAGKEFSIEQALDKMQSELGAVELEVMPYRETGTYIVKVEDTIAQMLDDSIVMTQSMGFSPFKAAFAERIATWDAKLGLVSDTLEAWIQVQRGWMYLEPIFSSPDISAQLPIEAKRFATVDRAWRKAADTAKRAPGLLAAAANPRLLDSLLESARLLDSVQKGLAAYLEMKRAGFARLFFLSNDELLAVLSQAKDPQAVQPHLKKCFEAIARLDFAADLKISSMQSPEGEVMPFDKPMYPEGSVEQWLSLVEERMRDAVHAQLVTALAAYATTPRTEWVLQWPAMIVLAVSAIFWSSGVEDAFAGSGAEAARDTCTRELLDLTEVVRGELSSAQRMTLGALITIDVHARDVVSDLAEQGVTSPADFEWVKQLRYYWRDDNLFVDMVQASLVFGYEYLGNTPRLVITPLTDRCYITLMSAMHVHLGGAPAGPAGTGKTETTKDLAKALAKQCVVFNCSDGLDYMAMAKFFKGLASSGAWACFDEFNRIDLEVLSVVAQQILTIQLAIMANVKRFVFEDSEIALNPACTVFITMNPGYAGRSELPDNLKALFRPCAMMVPDYALIAEVCLYSYGYCDSKILARKMVATFKLCSEQLSSQDHYDYGMRAVKSTITACGNLKGAFPSDPEDALVLRGLRDINIPKFLAPDLPLFHGIITDLFPGVPPPDVDYSALTNALSDACKIAKAGAIQPVDSFIGKAIQLYETTLVRHGLMLVGATMAGKSCAYRALADAMTALSQQDVHAGKFAPVRITALNPKAVTMGQLYGEFDPNTHEWTDGVLCCHMRSSAEDTSIAKKWMMFDGPVDAIWIENMNTVLDDNKKLCLVSGEVIALSSTMTMMFEVEDLAVASPATVSRCGMVYMEPSALGLRPLADSWLQALPEHYAEHRDTLLSLFEALVPPLIEFVRKQLQETVPTVDGNLCLGCFKIFGSLTEDAKGPGAVQAATVDPGDAAAAKEKAAAVVVPLFVFSVIWSIGGSCDQGSRAAFDEVLRDLLSNSGLELPEDAAPPASESVYEWMYDQEMQQWVDWMNTCPQFQCNPDTPFAEIMVPTADTIRYTFVMQRLLLAGHNVLAVGETGTGKTLAVQVQFCSTTTDCTAVCMSTLNCFGRNMLVNKMPSEFDNIFMTFSARTSANQTQDIIDSKMDKRRKGIFGPPAGKKFIIFVDDFNMPQREKYFAQPPLEVLRQWIDNGGWYERKPPCAWKTIIDSQIVASMGPPGGGRNPVTPRLLRHFSTVSFAELTDKSICRIFETITSAFATKYLQPDAAAAASEIVGATTTVYNSIRVHLLPTPSKSHYTFNLRDIAKVIQGVMRADPKTVLQSSDVMRLWLHECDRVFADRLVNDEDRTWLRGTQAKILNQVFSRTYEDVVTAERLVFGDFMIPNAEPKIYTQITDMAALMRIIEEYLEDYNSMTTSPMRLVTFLDAAEHVARVARILRTPLGHALLLGVGGSGRRSLARLGAHVEEYELREIEITKSYGPADWRDDLRAAFKSAGAAGKDVALIFSDTQIVWEGMLEDINNVLNTGEVPNLLKPEDLEEISSALRPAMVAEGLAVTPAGITAYFTRRVRARLHLVIAMSPLGEAFRRRLRMFPALVNCCTIDWFREWPLDALQSVAHHFYRDLPLQSCEHPDLISGVVSASVFIHQSVERTSATFFAEMRRAAYVTPTSYLELLNTFSKLLEERRESLGKTRGRLAVGLDKLASTAVAVEGMQKELKDLQPVLEKTAVEVEEMMVQIDADKAAAAETKAAVQQQEAAANEKAAQAKAIADDAQADLDKALPALDEAVQSLKSLTKSDVVEVKSLSNPPAGVKMVMDACCIMFDMKGKKVPDPNGAPGAPKLTDYWDDAKKILNDPAKFLNSLMTFDKENISNGVIKRVVPYIEMEEFHPDNVAKVSKACKSICQWVRAMYVYHNVALQVEPKRQALAGAQADLDATNKTLAKAQKQLAGVQEKIASLEAAFAEAMDKKAGLAKQVSDCTAKLQRADKLIGGLGGERVRWQDTVASLGEALINAVGDVIIASGSIAYSGPFTPLFRASLLEQWTAELRRLNVPFTEGTSLIRTLEDPVATRAWTIAGLPTDSVSVENGIIVTKARRWPLMIDPQGQANRWIRNMEKETGLDVVKPLDKDLLRSLENGVRFGRAVLLENVGESLDASLEPILLKQTFKTASGAESIKIGDSIIPYHPDFKFYMTTNLRNPHYAPEVAVKVSLLNFLVTPEGLEEQLLGTTVATERPDLANMKTQLVLSNARMKKELKDIEDKILFMLSNSQGNILDDEELINTLSQSKATSDTIQAKVAEAEATEAQIDATRELYRPVAARASLLFFCISDLATVDPMYQYSLTWFCALFVRAMADAPQFDDVAQRGVALNDWFTYSLYVNVCRSLFERHKLTLSFLLSIAILKSQGKIDAAEWRFLLAGPTETDFSLTNPAPEWLTEKSWTEVLNVALLPEFVGFDKHFTENVSHYKGIFDSNEAHELPLAEPFNAKLSTFQKLLFLRCIRPDKVMMAIQAFVVEHMGARFIEPPTFDLNATYRESDATTPLIFVLSAGADPMLDLLKLADEMKFSKKFEKVSLGQGQGPKAERLLREGMERGLWVCLQNCHLAVSWMPSMERIIEGIEKDKVHRDFRLWLTAMPTPAFPVAVLQNGIKMTLEPPKGLKSNLIRQFSRLDDTYLASCDKPDAWRKLLFGMCLFHAVVQDRRKFGALGWNIGYDFTDSDLSVSLTQMHEYLNTYAVIPFKVLRFLFTEINYGGRVTDGKDRRLINNLVLNFCNDGMLSDGYPFSPSATYTTSPAETVQEYMELLKQYPIVPKPEIFGLHDNADITCDQNETYDLFATVLSLQPRVSAGAGASREDIIMAKCEGISGKLPEGFDVEAVQKKYPTMYEESMNTVLAQECIRYNKLLEVMKMSLKETVRAIKGLVVMSSELEAVSSSVYDNQVPSMWEAKAYPSLKPLSSWAADLLERLTFVRKWIDDGIPAVYWISGFFFPQAFLTGTLQNFARKHKFPIDTTSLSYVVRDDFPANTSEGPEDGCYISGLFMEGARWDEATHAVGESRPKELFTSFPVIWLKPMQHRTAPTCGVYTCPVYKTLARAGTLSTTGHSTNFVMDVELPSTEEESHWINRGVALFCSLAF